jgi:pimeloyl-ACP methyl ester carboxylesterase
MLTPGPFADALTRRTLQRDGVEPIDYHVGGSGRETLAIVNAYGQSLAFWSRLVIRLATRYRILIWQARGSCSQHGGMASAYPVEEHVRDMRSLFAAEDVARAHLLGWCTGPKTALAFYSAYRPLVASMIMLTGCFVHKDHFKPLHTRYETTITELCRMVAQRPQVAGKLSEMFASVLSGQRRTVDGVPEQSRGDIEALVQAPFRSPESLVHYARQLLMFWDYNISPVLPLVTVPTLFISGEHDDVTHPKLSRECARKVPGATYAEVRGGSHYIHHEQHALLSDLVIDFTQHGYLFSVRQQHAHIERFEGSAGQHQLT